MHAELKPPPQCVLSIDVLRGLTIALMILVNDPGDWSHSRAEPSLRLFYNFLTVPL
jgi:predicted acyltransferase